jgi:hypothetical protein
MKGSAARHSVPKGCWNAVIAKTRFKPTGGVRQPIFRFRIMMIPSSNLS